MNSGIFIVRLLNESPIPVTRDKRYIDTCAKVNKKNIKIGRTVDFDTGRDSHFKDLGKKNVVFEPIARIKNIKDAKKLILRALKQYRKISPKGGKLDWLEGVSYKKVKTIVLNSLNESEIIYERI